MRLKIRSKYYPPDAQPFSLSGVRKAMQMLSQRIKIDLALLRLTPAGRIKMYRISVLIRNMRLKN